MTAKKQWTKSERLQDIVDEYLHWRKVNPHIKGGENYLKRLRDAKIMPSEFEVAKEELDWLKETAKDAQDRARVVGFEDCLRSWKSSSSKHRQVMEQALESLELRRQVDKANFTLEGGEKEEARAVKGAQRKSLKAITSLKQALGEK